MTVILENFVILQLVLILHNIKICDNCMIGAGAVVIKDINEGGVYIGVPARLTTVFEKL